jgi:hypothetical protein
MEGKWSNARKELDSDTFFEVTYCLPGGIDG